LEGHCEYVQKKTTCNFSIGASYGVHPLLEETGEFGDQPVSEWFTVEVIVAMKGQLIEKMHYL